MKRKAHKLLQLHSFFFFLHSICWCAWSSLPDHNSNLWGCCDGKLCRGRLVVKQWKSTKAWESWISFPGTFLSFLFRTVKSCGLWKWASQQLCKELFSPVALIIGAGYYTMASLGEGRKKQLMHRGRHRIQEQDVEPLVGARRGVADSGRLSSQSKEAKVPLYRKMDVLQGLQNTRIEREMAALLWINFNDDVMKPIRSKADPKVMQQLEQGMYLLNKEVKSRAI